MQPNRGVHVLGWDKVKESNQVDGRTSRKAKRQKKRQKKEAEKEEEGNARCVIGHATLQASALLHNTYRLLYVYRIRSVRTAVELHDSGNRVRIGS